MKIIVACKRCGHEREVDRGSIVKGDWRKQPCPVCQAKPKKRPKKKKDETP